MKCSYKFLTENLIYVYSGTITAEGKLSQIFQLIFMA